MNRTLPATLASIMVGCSATATAVPVPAPSASHESEPQLVLDHERLDAAYVLPAAAIEHEGMTHLWVVAFSGEEGMEPRHVHLTSVDGRAWDEAASATVLDGGALGLDRNGAIPSSVLVDRDGTWRLFGTGRMEGSDSPVIWTASAPSADGPWTFVDEPILQPTGDGWDGLVTDHPSVIPADDGYLMAYGGAGAPDRNRNRIGFARSTDGLSWERTHASLAEADDGRALGPSACGIDARSMLEPHLRSSETGLRLTFAAMGVGSDDMFIGRAESPDGMTWTCTTEGPILGPTDFEGAPGLHSYVALPATGRDLLLVEVLAPGSESSDLWLVKR